MSSAPKCCPDFPNQDTTRRRRANQLPIQDDLHRRNFEIGVGVAPKEGNTGQPVFRVDRLANLSKLLRSQEAGGGREFRPGNFSADGARCDLDLRVVADAFALAQFAVRHEVELAVMFGEPDGRVHRNPVLSEGGEADVTLALDFDGNGCHAHIVKRCRGLWGDWIPIMTELPRQVFLTDCAHGHIQ